MWNARIHMCFTEETQAEHMWQNSVFHMSLLSLWSANSYNSASRPTGDLLGAKYLEEVTEAHTISYSWHQMQHIFKTYFMASD